MAKKKTKYQIAKEKWLRQFRADFRRVSRLKKISRSSWAKYEKIGLGYAHEGKTPCEAARLARDWFKGQKGARLPKIGSKCPRIRTPKKRNPAPRKRTSNRAKWLKAFKTDLEAMLGTKISARAFKEYSAPGLELAKTGTMPFEAARQVANMTMGTMPQTRMNPYESNPVGPNRYGIPGYTGDPIGAQYRLEKVGNKTKVYVIDDYYIDEEVAPWEYVGFFQKKGRGYVAKARASGEEKRFTSAANAKAFLVQQGSGSSWEGAYQPVAVGSDFRRKKGIPSVDVYAGTGGMDEEKKRGKAWENRAREMKLNPLMMLVENPGANVRPWFWECGQCGFVTPRSTRTQAAQVGPCPKCSAESWVKGTREKSAPGPERRGRRNPMTPKERLEYANRWMEEEERARRLVDKVPDEIIDRVIGGLWVESHVHAMEVLKKDPEARKYLLTENEFRGRRNPGDSETTCPACGGEGILLGALGNLVHYRCRNCGAQFQEKARRRPRRRIRRR